MNRKQALAFVAKKRSQTRRRQMHKDDAFQLARGLPIDIVITKTPAGQFSRVVRAGLAAAYNPEHQEHWLQLLVLCCFVIGLLAGR